jgi:hypothetical protein
VPRELAGSLCTQTLSNLCIGDLDGLMRPRRTVQKSDARVLQMMVFCGLLRSSVTKLEKGSGRSEWRDHTTGG